MKIAQLVSNYHRVAADSPQAIYSSVATLSDSLIERGHQVSVFGAGNSSVKSKLVSVTDTDVKTLGVPENLIRHYLHALISECYSKADDFDIIHSHFNLLSSFYSRLKETPTIQSIHSPFSEATRPFFIRFKNNNYISFSHAQRNQMPELNWVANIYHGVDTRLFVFNPEAGDYFFYLGRITEEKGLHLAIEAALAAGVKLVIAGSSYPNEGYWQKKIEPKIDGHQIKYIGQADLPTKIEYLRRAKGLLFPSQINETFGLSMIEAMSCGTPVIGWDHGSIPEVIQDKETGFVVKTVAGMVKAVKAIDKISRQATRHRAEKFFSMEKMVSGYEKVYARVVEESLQKRKRR